MKNNEWALILGASSGFGEACAVELARAGLDIVGVHLDRKSTLPNVSRIISRIEETGRRALFFNANAADEEERTKIIDSICRLKDEQAVIRCFIHSLAFGAVRPFIGSESVQSISRPQLEMTLDVMANSLVYWVQDLLRHELLGEGGRIFAMTSAGSERVWPSYGAVSAAKSALESYIRQLAVELAPFGITCNAIRAGVTDTPALRRIPDYQRMVETASSRNPSGRLTTPQDVADTVVALMDRRTQWMTGNVIAVDGGEFISTESPTTSMTFPAASSWVTNT